jgi:Zn-dependent protease with chaperone function
MFGNFIYFILVLLIYLTYQPSDDTYFTAIESSTLFFCLTLIFALFTRFQFQKIESRISKGRFSHIDHQFSSTLLRQSIAAVVLFAVDIYGLNLPSFLAARAPFHTIPTLLALLFLLLFIFYLGIVWTFAYGPYHRLYQADISRWTYVVSNISFSIPVLLPWLLLSGIADVIQALPFEAPKQFLIQRFWRCQPLEQGYYRNRIEALCLRAGLAYADILYWPIFGGKMITAGVMGLVKRFRYILVTNSLLQLLEPEEVDAVIAHEIGHIKKKHLLFYLAFFVGYMLFSYVAVDAIVFGIISAEPVRWLSDNAGFSQMGIVSGIYSVVIICVFLIYFRFIFGYFMRNFERQADTYVYALFDSARPLISTLEKIAATSGQSADKPNWHHYSIRERIDYLKKCEQDLSWIDRHNTKVKKSISVYAVSLLLLGVLGYQLNIGMAGNRLASHFYERAILDQIEKHPDNADLYSLLGNVYFNRKNWAGVQEAWEKSLAIKPDNAETLNNLAWFYATCEDKQFLNPDRALSMATLAVRLENLPHIWDTLAESYYVSEMYSKAVEAGQQALELARENRGYYEDQLQKFKKAGAY